MIAGPRRRGPAGGRCRKSCARWDRRAQGNDLGPVAKPPQATVNKSKQMKAKLLGFAFIYFSESGLFNGLRRIQIKEIWARLKLWRQMPYAGQSSPLWPPRVRETRLDPASGKTYITDSCFLKEISDPWDFQSTSAPSRTASWRRPSCEGGAQIQSRQVQTSQSGVRERRRIDALWPRPPRADPAR
jgi:hypothetical protein